MRVASSEPRVIGDLNITSGLATIYTLRCPIILPQGTHAPPFLAIPRGLWRNMAWKHKSQIVQQLNQCFPRARKKDRMLSCRINQIQWTLRKAGRHKGFEDGLAVTMTSTHLDASLILSSMRLYTPNTEDATSEVTADTDTRVWLLPTGRHIIYTSLSSTNHITIVFSSV